tara:strand:+ start:35511 stop:35714 length:204 start_codon:yes stop_codon:yes gene_type:complete
MEVSDKLSRKSTGYLAHHQILWLPLGPSIKIGIRSNPPIELVQGCFLSLLQSAALLVGSVLGGSPAY